LWQTAMDHAWSTRFSDLELTTPCCGSPSNLNRLVYEWPAGFAKFVLEASGINVGRFLPEHQIDSVAETLGCQVRQILTRSELGGCIVGHLCFCGWRKAILKNRPSEGPVPFSEQPSSLLFLPDFAARRVRSLRIRGTCRSARGGVLEQYVKHGYQAQRRRRGLIACRSRKLVRKAGQHFSSRSRLAGFYLRHRRHGTEM
jgi:hypothetical protein